MNDAIYIYIYAGEKWEFTQNLRERVCCIERCSEEFVIFIPLDQDTI